MADATRVHARKAARIKASVHTLTLVFPVAYTPTSVVPTPGAQPASPLTGAPPAQTLKPPAAGSPTNPQKTVPCLWYDTMESPERSIRQDVWRSNSLGRIGESHILAEVLVSDVARDTSNPSAGTLFEDTDHVEHLGQTYRVLEVRAIGSAFALPVTYIVWLVGTANQPVS